MYPIDAITDVDEKTIKSFFSIYGDTECGPLNVVLREWNKNKKTLFKALGKQLSVSKEITVPKNDKIIKSELNTIYHAYIIRDEYDIIDIKNQRNFLHELTNNDFITDVLLFWVNQNYSIKDLYIISRLFIHHNILKGYICSLENDDPYHCQSFKCTIKNNMKTIRTIQRVLKATNYPNMDLFEKWRNQVSLIQTSNSTKAKLVISINPIDFISMSENECNWRSCMAWSNNGCYNAGTLEMMNSNIVAVAYLESKSPFTLHLSDEEKYNVPNKSWRSLVVIHKDILLLGKQYPYHDSCLTEIVLDFVRELVEKNLHWKYQFINQEYLDMKYLNGNFYLRDFFDVNHDKKKDHHCIFFYTNGMYNDFIEASYPHYYCCRNYVSKSKKICLSGPATCICCGARIYEHPSSDIVEYEDLGQIKWCYDCEHNHFCKTCKKYHYNIKYHTQYGNYCSDECIKDIVIFPDVKRGCNLCLKEELQMRLNSKIALFLDKSISQEDVNYLKESFRRNGDILYSLDNWIQNCLASYGARIYKVPRVLTQYEYTGMKYGSCSYHSESSIYSLYVYDLESSPHFWRYEEKIKQFMNRISLFDYVKGGDYENSSALIS